MKLGLGLSIPGVATMGGNQAERILSTAKHLYDARRGSAFTDYGSGGANGAATDVTHSGKWWTFNGTSSFADLWPVASLPMSQADQVTIVVVFRRDPVGAPAATVPVFSQKDSSANAARGIKLIVNTSANLVGHLGDGTNVNSKTATPAVDASGGALMVWVHQGANGIHAQWINGVQSPSVTGRGTPDNASCIVAANARVGTDAAGTPSGWLNGRVGLVAAYSRLLTATEIALVAAGMQVVFA